ncbi:hypothetical protein WJX72_010733 [[Myrmecia] bisecta]|uniref:Thioredoxin domain-containing protein n=1 Tax=[Myrmecia] bisecta TaxID=41462 RepID=A0AAW1P3Q4_9CHLO
MESMDPEKFKSRMHSLAYGQAMAAAARDYKKEMADAEKGGQQRHADIDVDELLDDPELERLHAERLAALQKEAEKRQALQRKGHGELQEVQEGDFLEIVTKAEKCVCHFFHRDFERCKIIDKHLGLLAKKYFDTRFIKLSAPDAPFFTVKLQVKVLPCILVFRNGVNVDRAVGFDDFGQKDDFPTSAVERKLLKSGVVAVRQKTEDDSDSDGEREQIRHSIFKSTEGRTGSDEDSDFD